MKGIEVDFKTYTGTKTIQAAPMSAVDAKECGARITDETLRENIGHDGYLIVYPDGYRSWSPKEVFEEAYSLSETHVDRMKIELADLTERICKATKAFLTPGLLPDDQRVPLKEQLSAMNFYARVLLGRIRTATQRKEADNDRRIP